MSALAIARYLPEFDAAGEPQPAPGAVAVALLKASKPGAVDEAFARGLERGQAAAEAEFAARLAEQQARHDAELTTAREAWALQEGGKLADLLAAGLKDIEKQIAAVTARVLQPFLAAELRNRAIADLAENLNVLLAQGGAASVAVFGAPDLLEALRIRLGGDGAGISYHPGQTGDVRVTVGQTVLETRLGDWVAKIEEALR
jgi:hypothetical protein